MTAKRKSIRRKLPPLEERFLFTGDAVAPADLKALRSALFDVEDQLTGLERSLKLWRKTGTAVDDDLRQLWLHEMRQVQRVMAYAGARDVILDVIEIVEDAESFGLLQERAGRPLSVMLEHAGRQHWLRNLSASSARALFWRNLRRVATALGIIHAQGLVHGRLGPESIMTDGATEPDFRLSGFEWSLWVGADRAERAQAKLGDQGAARRAPMLSFAEDWKAFGLLAARSLDVQVASSGDILPKGRIEPPINLGTAERVLLKRLVMPTRLDNLDAASISRAIDDVVADIGRSSSIRSGVFILMFAQNAGLGDTIYDASGGAIPTDEYRAQLDWVRADLAAGATLLAPRKPAEAPRLTLVTNSLVCRLAPFRDQGGSSSWDVAVCNEVKVRDAALHIGERDEHELLQPIQVVASSREATQTRAQLAPNALDWSAIAGSGGLEPPNGRAELVRRALLMVQVIEAVVKALEVYPVQILKASMRGSQRFAVLRALPGNDRDVLARRIGMAETSAALKRLFEDDHRDAEGKWRLSPTASLGAARHHDVTAAFVDVVDHQGLTAYEFELDEEPPGGPLFLRAERDTGTEQVILRRLHNLKALQTRVDLADMLDDPWRVRRSSRESLGDQTGDAHFQDLDEPKRKALEGIWSTLPAFLVVGPPGVGKTRLATETVRRRFSEDRTTRMLLSAQGHDALDNLQESVRLILEDNAMDDVIVVRSTANEGRVASEEDIHQTAVDYLTRLAESHLTREAPPQIRERVHNLRQAAARVRRSTDSVDREERVALNAISSLVLDAANIVISTANSPDIERMVEAREQFDWVIVEEAAKATGPELVGPMMLSGRRLLIGDHHQLPPYEADRLVKVLRDQTLVRAALEVAERYVAPLLRDGELVELAQVISVPETLRQTADAALRLFEPFRTLVEEDERLASGNAAHRPISATLTEQRRMDPAIAMIVSRGFYRGDLKTEARRTIKAETESPPVRTLAALPVSPVVAVDMTHVSSTGHKAPVEHRRPRWHNPGEVSAVFNVLKHVRAADSSVRRPTLAVLSFYKAQVEKLTERIDAGMRSGELAHLTEFQAVRGRAWVHTVDGFQGSEADLIVLSLVRNNSGTGGSALGFLRDRRRWNVALSRAKSKLVIVGSLAFLREAVRGVNPDAGEHDLSFITGVVDTLGDLTHMSRADGVPLACVISPTILAVRGAAC